MPWHPAPGKRRPKAPASGVWRSIPRLPAACAWSLTTSPPVRAVSGCTTARTSPVLTPAAACSTTGTSGAPPYCPGSIVVEYEPASDTPRELEPPFTIRAISHQARTAVDATAGTKDPADFCELDANCYPDWHSTMSSVAQISFVDGGDEFLCSGSLRLHARQQLQALSADCRPLHQQRGRRAHRRGLLDLSDAGLRRRSPGQPRHECEIHRGRHT